MCHASLICKHSVYVWFSDSAREKHTRLPATPNLFVTTKRNKDSVSSMSHTPSNSDKKASSPLDSADLKKVTNIVL